MNANIITTVLSYFRVVFRQKLGYKTDKRLRQHVNHLLIDDWEHMTLRIWNKYFLCQMEMKIDGNYYKFWMGHLSKGIYTIFL